MSTDFSFQYFRFHLEPKGALQMTAYNKGSTLRLAPKGNGYGFGSDGFKGVWLVTRMV